MCACATVDLLVGNERGEEMNCVRRACSVTLLLGILVAASGSAAYATGTAPTITIASSDGSYGVLGLLAQRYASIKPAVRIGITAADEKQGFDDACSGRAEMATSADAIQDAQLAEPGCRDMMNIPIALDAVCIIYNLPGSALNRRTADGFTLMHPLHLSRQVLATLYQDKHALWNDQALTAMNTSLGLPAQMVHAFALTEPADVPSVLAQWLMPPAAQVERVPSAGAMVQAVRSTPYSLGYVSLSYAISYHLQVAAFQNASGAFQTPSRQVLLRHWREGSKLACQATFAPAWLARLARARTR